MTRQICDKLIRPGEELWVTMRLYIPEHSRIRELTDDEMQNLFAVGPHGLCVYFSTICTRQFTAIWEIKDDKLYLNKVKGRYQIIGEEPVFADWFTDTLRVGAGYVCEDLWNGLFPRFVIEISYIIEAGYVIEERYDFFRSNGTVSPGPRISRRQVE